MYEWNECLICVWPWKVHRLAHDTWELSCHTNHYKWWVIWSSDSLYRTDSLRAVTHMDQLTIESGGPCGSFVIQQPNDINVMTSAKWGNTWKYDCNLSQPKACPQLKKLGLKTSQRISISTLKEQYQKKCLGTMPEWTYWQSANTYII